TFLIKILTNIFRYNNLPRNLYISVLDERVPIKVYRRLCKQWGSCSYEHSRYEVERIEVHLGVSGEFQELRMPLLRQEMYLVPIRSSHNCFLERKHIFCENYICRDYIEVLV